MARFTLAQAINYNRRSAGYTCISVHAEICFTTNDNQVPWLRYPADSEASLRYNVRLVGCWNRASTSLRARRIADGNEGQGRFAPSGAVSAIAILTSRCVARPPLPG